MEFKILSRIVRIKSRVDCDRSKREEIKKLEDENMLMPKFRQRSVFVIFSKNVSRTL